MLQSPERLESKYKRKVPSGTRLANVAAGEGVTEGKDAAGASGVPLSLAVVAAGAFNSSNGVAIGSDGVTSGGAVEAPRGWRADNIPRIPKIAATTMMNSNNPPPKRSAGEKGFTGGAE